MKATAARLDRVITAPPVPRAALARENGRPATDGWPQAYPMHEREVEGRAMRHPIFAALLLVACATQGGMVRSNARSSRAATDAAEAMIRGDYVAALAITDRGLAKDGGDPWLLYNRGAALAGLGRLDEALQTLRDAEPRFSDPHQRSLAVYRRGLVLEFAGRCAEASTEYSRYAALVRNQEPQLADDAMSHVAFCIAPTAQELAERDKAARLNAAVADKNMQKSEAASTAAVRALTVGDYGAALARADEGLAIARDDPWLLYNKGTALAGLGRTDEALPILRQAERQFSAGNIHGRSVATYRRAMALEVAGRCEEESAELQHFTSLVGASEPKVAEHAKTHLKYCRLANTGRTTF